jgi:hypothetical protein
VDLDDKDWSALITDSRTTIEGLINEFFKAKLLGIPDVRGFLEGLEDSG